MNRDAFLAKLEKTKGVNPSRERVLNVESTAFTDPMIALHKEGIDPELIVFVDPAKRRNQQKKDINTSNVSAAKTDTNDVISRKSSDLSRLSLMKIFQEVNEYGLTGLSKQIRKNVQTNKLLKLGAKPGKQVCHNYRHFLQMNKRQTAKAEARGYKRVSTDKPKRKDRNDILNHVGAKIGRFRNGVQVLQKDEIEHVRKSKLRR